MPRIRLTRTHLLRALSGAALALVLVTPAATSAPTDVAGADRWSRAPRPTAVVGYRSASALAEALRRHQGRVVRAIPALGVAEVAPRAHPRHFASAVSHIDGIAYVEPPTIRRAAAEPALLPSATSLPGGILEWQYAATRADAVPESVLRAAGAFTIAVVDTGADLSAPDLAAKAPVTYSVVTGAQDVRDTSGHGTFVTALAAGSVTNGEGIAGFGGDARLLVVQASRIQGAFTDLDEAAAIVWAVDHGAKIVNLSLGGPDTSSTERSAVDYASSRGTLLVAAAGNEYESGNPVEYPAALLQPVGSSGRGGVGLAVGASDTAGQRAPFSNTGSHISLVAPGVNVLSALASTAENARYTRVPLPGSLAGLYGYGSGTSFAAPQVAGAAALVWAANPLLSAPEVAEIIEQTASGKGAWNDQTGYGVLDVGAAVERASGAGTVAAVRLSGEQLTGARVRLSWEGTGAFAYRLTVGEGAAGRVLIPSTRKTATVFRGRFGSSYAFTVTALDAAGTPAASSEPLVVALPAAGSALSLSVSGTAGRGPRNVVLRARLTPQERGVPAGARRLAVEAVEGGRPRRVASARTSVSGEAVWRLALSAGLHRLRARFDGADDLRAAVSAPVTILVR